MCRILDTLHLALVVQTVYVYTVAGFGDVSKLSQVILSVKVRSLLFNPCLLILLIVSN